VYRVEKKPQEDTQFESTKTPNSQNREHSDTPKPQSKKDKKKQNEQEMVGEALWVAQSGSVIEGKRAQQSTSPAHSSNCHRSQIHPVCTTPTEGYLQGTSSCYTNVKQVEKEKVKQEPPNGKKRSYVRYSYTTRKKRIKRKEKKKKKKKARSASEFVFPLHFGRIA
jgi:hypothetical protein